MKGGRCTLLFSGVCHRTSSNYLHSVFLMILVDLFESLRKKVFSFFMYLCYVCELGLGLGLASLNEVEWS